MKGKFIWFMVSCLVGAALVLASCGPSEEAEEEEEVTEEEQMAEEEQAVEEEEEVTPSSNEPQYGGVLTIIHETDPVYFDDVLGNNGGRAYPIHLTTEELGQGDWTRGPAGTNEVSWGLNSFVGIWNYYKTGLAESWDMNADDLSLTFHIRHGVNWQNRPPTNGRELVADDVAFSIKRAYDTPTSLIRMVNPMPTSITATDKYTVVVKFNALFELNKSLVMLVDLLTIWPRDAVEYYGDMSDWQNHVGTGPFIMTDYVKASSITLTRNDNYWDTDPIGPGMGNQLPYLDGVKFLIIPDGSTRAAAMRTGKAAWGRFLIDDAKSLEQTNPGILSAKAIGQSLEGGLSIFLRMDNPDFPWYDKNVRHALMMGVDLQAIADEFYSGEAAVYHYPTDPGGESIDYRVPMDELPESVQELYIYNPDKAKQLLDDAGYGDGFTLDLVCRTQDVDLLSIYKDYWSKIGVNLIIDAKEYAVWNSMVRSRSYTNAVLSSTATHVAFDLVDLLDPTTSINNRTLVKCDKCQEAYEEIWGTLDWDEQCQIFKEITPYILENAWEIPTPGFYWYTLWQPWLKNYHGEYSVGNSSVYSWAKWVWVDQDLKEGMTGTR